MAVKHLGQFAQPRPSDLSGLAEGIKTGMEAGENRQRTKILKQQAGTQAQEANIRSQQLKLAVAKEEQAEKTKGRALAEQSHKALSLRLMGKSDAEIQMVMESDPIKAVTKDLFKVYMPEIVDEKTGYPIPARLNFIPKNAEEARKVAELAKEGMNDIEAKRLPTITKLEAMKSQIMSTAWMANKEEAPETLDQMADIDSMYEAAMKVVKDANPNVFTKGMSDIDPLGGGKASFESLLSEISQ